jgi:hypothetical protein
VINAKLEMSYYHTVYSMADREQRSYFITIVTKQMSLSSRHIVRPEWLNELDSWIT